MIQSNNQLTSNSQALQPVAPVDSRKMLKAALLGQHSHLSVCGIEVHIWLRGTTYLARGRCQGKAFGETLGNNPQDAACKLRHLLVEMDNGTFLRSSDRPKRQLRRGLPPKLDIRSLCDAFLVDKRQVCGKDTTQKYRSRLLLLIEFAESIETRRRWKLASDVDRNFVLEFRKFLNQQQVTRNGRAASEKKPIAPTQIYNVLDCSRTLFNWARRPEINMLPISTANPFTDELVGRRIGKDPLKPPTDLSS